MSAPSFKTSNSNCVFISEMSMWLQMQYKRMECGGVNTPLIGPDIQTQASSNRPDCEVWLAMGMEWKCSDTGSKAADSSNVTTMK